MVANEFNGLAEAVGEGIVREELVGAFVSLLKDVEAEVRTAGAGQIPGGCSSCEVVGVSS
jgi:serine/threonine-protein phosphatase 2A regulatory subunit A